MNRMNASRSATVTFGMVLVALLSDVIPLTHLYAQVRPKMQIAFVTNRAGNSEIYVIDGDGKNLRNLTNNPDTDRDPAWSPNGQKIVFSSNREGNYDIYMMNADGTNIHQLTNHPADDWQPTVTFSVSPVGKRTTVWGRLKQAEK